MHGKVLYGHAHNHHCRLYSSSVAQIRVLSLAMGGWYRRVVYSVFKAALGGSSCRCFPYRGLTEENQEGTRKKSEIKGRDVNVLLTTILVVLASHRFEGNIQAKVNASITTSHWGDPVPNLSLSEVRALRTPVTSVSGVRSVLTDEPRVNCP